MNRLLLRWHYLILAVCLVAMAGSVGAVELKPGDKAPDFELTGSDGKSYRLSDLIGEQAVVLALIPFINPDLY